MITDLTKPISKTYACPSCAKGNVPDRWFLQGIHILADCRCEECNTEYYHTLPLAHARDLPISFSKDGKYADYPLSNGAWLARPLIRSMTSTPEESVYPISLEEFTPCQSRNAILVNCLDDCFGHVFTKLCNLTVVRKKYPSACLIAILPKKMAWLIPNVVNEAWMVDGELTSMKDRITGLDSFAHEQINRFDECMLHEVSIYADPVEVDYEDYLKIPSFDYTRRKEISAQVVFILREDRFWHRHGWEELLFKILVKMKWLNSLKGILVNRQNKLVMQVVRKLREENKSLRVVVAGIGTSGSFPDTVTDLRKNEPSQDDEREWLTCFAESHVVIGVHGSNMIIPGIQAAAMVEIVPPYKVTHIGETTLKDYPVQGLCRHLTGSPSPADVSKVVLDILKTLSRAWK